MYQALSSGTLHLLAIDLTLACVLVAPLLLAANALRKDSNPALIVIVVILMVLGASSLFVALVETQPASEALRTGQAGAEVLEYQRNLVIYRCPPGSKVGGPSGRAHSPLSAVNSRSVPERPES